MGLGIEIGDQDWGLGFEVDNVGLGSEDWRGGFGIVDYVLKIGIGILNWDQGTGYWIGTGDWYCKFKLRI